MRRFFRFIGQILFWTFAAIGGLLAISILAGFFIAGNWLSRKHEIPNQAWLYADLTQGIRELGTEEPWEGYFSTVPRMQDFAFGLREAAKDARIKGLFIELNSAYMGGASIEEIHQAIDFFRASGKPVYVFAETFTPDNSGMANYYLASVADKIFLQPSGDLGIVGYAIEQPFVRGILDKLGIEPQMDGRKDFKGALFSITKDMMPESVRHNLQNLTDEWLAENIQKIADARHLPAATLRDHIKDAPLSADGALQASLIDGARYRDEALEDFLSTLGLDDKAGVELTTYRQALKEPDADTPNIAIIPVTGEIVSGDGDLDGKAGANTFSHSIGQAIEDKVKAIIIRVNSPGGSYVAADRMWHDVGQAQAAGIPVIVSMGDLAASGGYFLTLKADRIFAHPSSLVGSIGVFGGKFVLEGLWDKIGLMVDGVASGEHALMESPHRRYSPEEWQKFQESLDRIYADFTEKVAAGRKMQQAQVEAIAQGQVFSGRKAKELGLIDDLGGLEEAFMAARDLAKIGKDQEVKTIYYPSEQDMFQSFAKQFMQSVWRGEIKSGEADLTNLLARFIKSYNEELIMPPLWLQPVFR